MLVEPGLALQFVRRLLYTIKAKSGQRKIQMGEQYLLLQYP